MNSLDWKVCELHRQPFSTVGRLITSTGRIQQPAFIPACAFYLQGNAGAAVINGAELELSGRVNHAFSIRAGLGYQHARITEKGSSNQAVGSRIKQVPTWTATLRAFYEQALSDTLKVFASADYSNTGDSTSSNSYFISRPLGLKACIWKTAQKNYWKEKAEREMLIPSGKYSVRNIGERNQGRAPNFKPK